MRSVRLILVLSFLFAVHENKSQDLNFSNGPLFDIPYGYLIPTIAFSTGNGIFITRNIIKMQGPDRKRSNAGFGIITGITQTMYGIIYQGQEKEYTKNIAAIDILFGLTTIATSTIRLFKKQPAENKAVSLDIIPLRERRTGTVVCGLHLSADF